MNELVAVERMKRDLRAAATMLSRPQARYFVDEYYQMQENRIRAENRVRAMTESEEPHEIMKWFEAQQGVLEQQVKSALDKYTQGQPIGQWMRSVRGIGPVIAAGFMSRLDINRKIEGTEDLECTTAGHFWSICGLNPSLDAEGLRQDRRIKGKKLNYDPALKRLAYLAGESFKRLGKDDEDGFYRHWYDKRKAYETGKNEAGDYADQAKQALTEKKFGEDTAAIAMYKQGKLPLARIDRRAARWACKLFLSHMHQVWWAIEHGHDTNRPYPKPYAHAHLPYIVEMMGGHVDIISPPNLHVIGLEMRNGAVMPMRAN